MPESRHKDGYSTMTSPYQNAREKIRRVGNRKSTRLDSPQMNLEKVPPEIGDLDKLQTLNLQENELSEIPVELAKLKNLEKLDLGGNPLEYPSEDVVDEGFDTVIEFLEDELEKEESEEEP